MTTAVVMAGVNNDNDREDSDMDERGVKGVSTHDKSDFGGATRAMTLNTVGATNTTTSSRSSSTETFGIRECKSGFCGCCGCFWGTRADCYEFAATNIDE